MGFNIAHESRAINIKIRHVSEVVWQFGHNDFGQRRPW